MGRKNVMPAKLRKINHLHHQAKNTFCYVSKQKKAFPKIKYLFKNRLEKFEANCYRNEKNLLAFRKNISKNFSTTTLLKLVVELKTRPLQGLIAILISARRMRPVKQ